ncbi:LLM class flavin-dependent oxidoreductase [Paenibacillus sp. N4]|uniref:LLM class flavin-dependent oxidoreductase n=1 Tax=Paenibacillus vietnamensis TaxID=2590547 RepID=UPI001CD1631F|nr:LLM class flavin-dependent oxidoreductase [Paenibacillus vietnamensis]MCA0754776.1 LLM class flavin-dependent oxidoreductase [Paenibacillus vietnamensis]
MGDFTQKAPQAGFEFGIYTLGDICRDPVTGRAATAGTRMKEIVAAAKLADDAGLDLFGVGEHHRLDFAVSSPPVVLAAIASVTSRIRLTSATTVLGTSDPVRVFEDFATLDLLSEGRAELIAGRGAYVESFPLFGYELADYKELFYEKMNLLLELNEKERVTWSGSKRTPLLDAEIAPRPLQRRLPLWIGVGGTPASAELAGELGAGMALAILGGDPARFKPLVDAYRAAGMAAGRGRAELPVAITSHGYIAETSRQAREEYYPYYANYVYRFMGGATRGERLSKEQFERLASPVNALAVGSPEEIVEKILAQHELFGHSRFIAQFDIGGVPFSKVAASIELLAAKVAPAVRKALGSRQDFAAGKSGDFDERIVAESPL